MQLFSGPTVEAHYKTLTEDLRHAIDQLDDGAMRGTDVELAEAIVVKHHRQPPELDGDVFFDPPPASEDESAAVLVKFHLPFRRGCPKLLSCANPGAAAIAAEVGAGVLSFTAELKPAVPVDLAKVQATVAAIRKTLQDMQAAVFAGNRQLTTKALEFVQARRQRLGRHREFLAAIETQGYKPRAASS